MSDVQHDAHVRERQRRIDTLLDGHLRLKLNQLAMRPDPIFASRPIEEDDLGWLARPTRGDHDRG